jgi:hypothetical protein
MNFGDKLYDTHHDKLPLCIRYINAMVDIQTTKTKRHS